MGRLDQKRRGENKRKQGSSILIGCEGNNRTEKNFFSSFATRNCRIRFSDGNRTDPVGMANDLISYAKRNELSAEYGDKLYLVLDTDVNQNKAEQIKSAKKLCDENCIELITSTPSFEYWYLLCFENTAKQYTNNKQLIVDLKKYIKDYSKTKDVCKEVNNKNITEAIERAKMIEEKHKENGIEVDSEEANPHTSIYKIIEEIIRRNIE